MDRRPHTIADALLDASTTNESGFDRRKHARSRSQLSKETGRPLPRAAGQADIGTEHPSMSSPAPSSPTVAPRSRPLSPLLSTVERRERTPRNRESPGDESSSAPTDPDNPTLKTVSGGVQRKPSAISLLNRKDTAKAFAETSTTSANAFGKVDVPSQSGISRPPSLALARDGAAPQSVARQYRANHSYGGDDPVILRLLDSVFAENYPTDLFDLGPYVKDVDVRRPIRRAGGSASGRTWRPEGNLVALFGEHSGPVNRVAVAPDHAFFVTASDDGTVKIWDTLRLEKNLTPRSRQTHRHPAGAKVKALTFVENTYTFISGATDGSIHAVKVDYHNVNDAVRYGKLQLVRDYQLPTSEDGTVEYPLWMEHFRSDTQSTLLVATNTCRILALDMKTMELVYSLQNPVHHGTPTTFCCDRKHNWLLVGTTHGVLDLWDLRFRVRLRAWGLPGAGSVHRLRVHPTKGRGRWVCVACNGPHGNEITVWDIEKVQCREVYRAASASMYGASGSPAPQGGHGDGHDRAQGPSPSRGHRLPSWQAYEAWRVDGDRPEGMLSRFATAGSASAAIDSNGTPLPGQTSSNNTSASGDRNGICAFAVGFDNVEDGKDSTKCGFIISAGCDRKIRFWDLARPELSAIVSGLEIASDGASTGKPRYEVVQPMPNLMMTTEYLPSGSDGSGGVGTAKKAGAGGGAGGGRPPRSTVISLQQQQLLKSHLDSIQDVAFLRVPYGMTVSVDRAGMVYVFQ